MKTKIFSTVLVALVAHLAPCLAEDGIQDQAESKDIEEFLKSRDSEKAKELEGKYDGLGVRLYSIEAVGKLKDKDALPLLLSALDDKHPQVRLWAALALRELGQQAAVKSLIEKLGDTEEVACYGACRSKRMANVRLGVRLRVSVCDAVIETLNSLIPERKEENKFFGIFYPSEKRKKSRVFNFYGMNLPERPDTGHWGNPAERKEAVKELQQWWQKNKEKPQFRAPTRPNLPGNPT